MPAQLPRFTPWELTSTQFRVLLALQKHLDTQLAAKELGISDSAVRTHMKEIRALMSMPTSWGCVVLFDRWTDSNSGDCDRIKQLLGL